MKTDYSGNIFEKHGTARTVGNVHMLRIVKRSTPNVNSGTTWRVRDWLIEFLVVSMIWFTIIAVWWFI